MRGISLMSSALILGAVVGGFAGAAAAGDDKEVLGTWKLKYNPGNGDTESDLTVTKDGKGYKVVLGTGDKKLTGKDVRVKDGVLKFKVETEHEGTPVSIDWEAKVKGDAVKGEAKYDYGGMTGSFEFEGKREEAKSKK